MHLKLAFDWTLKPLYDVIAKIPGSVYPDEWVIRGNHHDGWVNGAEDPISGQVAELEEARAMGELLKQGWKPKRTIVYAPGTARSPRCSVPRSGSRSTSPNCRRRRCSTSTPMATDAACWISPARTR